jgi:hypothetical protein
MELWLRSITTLSASIPSQSLAKMPHGQLSIIVMDVH